MTVQKLARLLSGRPQCRRPRTSENGFRKRRRLCCSNASVSIDVSVRVLLFLNTRDSWEIQPAMEDESSIPGCRDHHGILPRLIRLEDGTAI
jgi:hypothetical protein